MDNQHAGLSQALAGQRITERHEQAAHARLLRQARATIHAEASKPSAQGAVHGRRVRRLLLWGAMTLLVAALLALGVLLPAGIAHARVADERGGQAGERTPATEHHAVPTPTGRQATSAEPAAPSGTRPLLVVVGAASLTVMLAAAATFPRLRARPRAAT
jgi:hypothetical protein